MSRRSERIKKLSSNGGAELEKGNGIEMILNTKEVISPGNTQFVELSHRKLSRPLSNEEKHVVIAEAQLKKKTSPKLEPIILPAPKTIMTPPKESNGGSGNGGDLESEETELDRTLSLPDDWLFLENVDNTPPEKNKTAGGNCVTPPNTPCSSVSKRMAPPGTPTVLKKKQKK